MYNEMEDFNNQKQGYNQKSVQQEMLGPEKMGKNGWIQ
jgi:hypothetical protein